MDCYLPMLLFNSNLFISKDEKENTLYKYKIFAKD